MNKFQVLLFIIIFFLNAKAISQSLVCLEDAQKAKTIKDKIPEGKELLVFEANFDLTIESSMENLEKPIRDKNLYKVFISERSCVITIKNKETLSEKQIPFGQLSTYSLPILQKGEVKYYVISMEKKLSCNNITDEKKKEGASDNQMLYEREALLIIEVDPVELEIEFKSTKEITNIRNDEKGRYRLYVKPEDQIITLKDNITNAYNEINLNGIMVKEVRYYAVYLKKNLRKNEIAELKESEKKHLKSNQPSENPIDTNKIYGFFTDERDGTMYKFIIIDDQKWMAQNLNYATETGSWCYNEDTSFCAKFGRLYDWKTSKKVCPNGWHLPSDNEWSVLTNFVTSPQCEKLKSRTGWKDNGTDVYNFNALPAGGLIDGMFKFTELNTYWWTSTPMTKNEAASYSIYNNRIDFSRDLSKINSGFSVRCVSNK